MALCRILEMLPFLIATVLSDRSFKVAGNDFVMDGKPFHFISGSLHYFRVHPDRWEVTIKKMANGGLNGIQTYVSWNLHEPTKGTYKFDGILDIVRFVQLCQAYNMYVLLRPGPYICAEWDFGGFPWWFAKHPGFAMRRSDPVFLGHVRDFWNVLLQKLRPSVYAHGGNIIMVQIENEYAYGTPCDKTYLRALANIVYDNFGKEIQLYTTDGNRLGSLECGSLRPEAYAIIDFAVGTDPLPGFEMMRKFNGGGPYAVTECWPGWPDFWGFKHDGKPTSKVIYTLDRILSLNGSVNFYMYIGGTNFGFMNGASMQSGLWRGIVTSYDYDAPLSESGDMTWKYEKMLETIKKYRTNIPVYDVKNSTKKSYGRVRFTGGCSLFDAIPTLTFNSTKLEVPITMEDLNVGYGFVLYRTTTTGGVLWTGKVRDRANILVNEASVDLVVGHGQEKRVEIRSGNLDILVESLGHGNAPAVFDPKGLLDVPTVNNISIHEWTSIGLDMEKVTKLPWGPASPGKAPSFYRGTFEVDVAEDTFLNPTGWERGNAWINGFNLGRYWMIGPQVTLYIPGPLLRVGENELIIFENVNASVVGTMSLDAVPRLGHDSS
jgi:hypothetical protein